MHNNQSLSSNLTKVMQVFTKSQRVTFSFNISYAYKFIEKYFLISFSCKSLTIQLVIRSKTCFNSKFHWKELNY